jgi:hypothetical protein
VTRKKTNGLFSNVLCREKMAFFTQSAHTMIPVLPPAELDFDDKAEYSSQSSTLKRGEVEELSTTAPVPRKPSPSLRTPSSVATSDGATQVRPVVKRTVPQLRRSAAARDFEDDEETPGIIV